MPDEKDKLWTLLKQVDFDQAMEVSIKPVWQRPVNDAEPDGLAVVSVMLRSRER
jgi:hypothetical protein